MTSNRKPRREGRGENGALQKFLSTSYKQIEDFSILKRIAFGGYPEPIRFLSKIKLQQIQLERGKL